jgi:hypothetical protein
MLLIQSELNISMIAYLERTIKNCMQVNLAG